MLRIFDFLIYAIRLPKSVIPNHLARSRLLGTKRFNNRVNTVKISLIKFNQGNTQ